MQCETSIYKLAEIYNSLEWPKTFTWYYIGTVALGAFPSFRSALGTICNQEYVIGT